MGNHSSKPSCSTASNQYALRTQPRLCMWIMPLTHFDYHVHRNCDRFSRTAEYFPKHHTFIRELQKVLKREGVQPRELEFLKSFPENNSTIRCLAFFDKQPTPEDCCIILEHCPVGDLHTFYWNRAASINNGAFSEAFMWSIFSQLANAAAFLHEGIGCKNAGDANLWRPIIHRDIKLKNILVRSLGSNDDFSEITIKLSDFGVAAYYDPKAASDLNFAGIPAYGRQKLPGTRESALQQAISGPLKQCKEKWLEENAGKKPYHGDLSRADQAFWWAREAAPEAIPTNLAIDDQVKDDPQVFKRAEQLSWNGAEDESR
ncbi:ATP binding [Ascochyta rabiei]|uniref:Autophagy-related protein 1 n=1 Tax=Didymella rabiei TaxID=5454 RepID=A0A163E2A9_DIDRA|nr:ATP binding [Ascochyta rabiei]